MKHRIAVIATLLATLGAVFGATAAQAATTLPQSATTQYTIDNVKFGCIYDPGHGNVVSVSFTICNTTFTFTNPVTTEGYTWYLLRINGGSDCLNYTPKTGFVYDDSCIPGDSNELWQHHFANLLGNLSQNVHTAAILSTCNATGNSRLILAPLQPTGCTVALADQYTWEIKTS